MIMLASVIHIVYTYDHVEYNMQHIHLVARVLYIHVLENRSQQQSVLKPVSKVVWVDHPTNKFAVSYEDGYSEQLDEDEFRRIWCDDRGNNRGMAERIMNGKPWSCDTRDTIIKIHKKLIFAGKIMYLVEWASPDFADEAESWIDVKDLYADDMLRCTKFVLDKEQSNDSRSVFDASYFDWRKMPIGKSFEQQHKVSKSTPRYLAHFDPNTDCLLFCMYYIIFKVTGARLDPHEIDNLRISLKKDQQSRGEGRASRPSRAQFLLRSFGITLVHLPRRSQTFEYVRANKRLFLCIVTPSILIPASHAILVDGYTQTNVVHEVQPVNGSRRLNQLIRNGITLVDVWFVK